MSNEHDADGDGPPPDTAALVEAPDTRPPHDNGWMRTESVVGSGAPTAPGSRAAGPGTPPGPAPAPDYEEHPDA